MSVNLRDLMPCFQGIVPSILSTCGIDGEPNVTYLSQVHFVDERHVALSCQFFNKTRRNVEENPYAAVVLHHPLDFEAWRLRLRFLRSEFTGPLFDTMADRIRVIASHTGMTGVFRLRSADVYEVISAERLEGFLLPPDPVLDAQVDPLPPGPLTEIRGLQVISELIARASDLDALFSNALTALDELLGFSHSMILLHEEACRRLVAIATRGYGSQGIGGEVRVGEGIVGTVAEQRRMIRVGGLAEEIRYGRAIRGRVEACGGAAQLAPEIPLPGLADAQAQLALPLLVGDRLLGVLAVESRDPLCFDEWDEAFLQILGNQIAMGIERLQSTEEEADPADETRAEAASVPPPARSETPPATGQKHRFIYYRQDESIFVDGEYLIRNVPARILWKILGIHQREGRTEFSNRELRLDPGLGLPPIKDNLESRLILLRKRLLVKCPEVRIVPRQRGRFGLELAGPIELSERETG